MTSLKSYITDTKPKKAIISLFILQFILLLFVSGKGIIIIAIITNTLIFAYGLYLLSKEDYDSLRFFFKALLVLYVANLFSKLL